MAAFGRPQPAVADRPGSRFLDPPPAARMDQPTAPQRRNGRGRSRLARHPRSAKPGAPESRRRAGRPAIGEPVAAGRALERNCSTRPAPGETAPSSTASRSRITSATRTAGPTGGCGEGYGRLFERLAEGLPVALGTAVSRIDHGGRAIRLDTTRGTVTARRVIVTVPTSILAAEVLRFDPPCPTSSPPQPACRSGSTTSSSSR